jgi:hypothetical protein
MTHGEKYLHILHFNVAYPADYGGAIDAFYKLKALHNAGVKIFLHCFEYGRGRQPILSQFCEEVFYYPRNTDATAALSTLPYIVNSRKNEALLNNLLKNDYPIFMEGVHCTYLLNDERFKKRRTYVRLHNVEQEYYKGLYSTSTHWGKKAYFLQEFVKLKYYEASIAKKATAFWAVTDNDVQFYRQNLGAPDVDVLPLFLPDWPCKTELGLGGFCLYHADLSIEANEKAAIWLIEKVFQPLKLPLVIAGKNPSAKLEQIAHKDAHTCLVANPADLELNDMIAKAQINVLPAFNTGGMKLKLLHALYSGKFLVANSTMLQGTPFAEACTVANSAEEFTQAIAGLYNEYFTELHLAQRKTVLGQTFDNDANAQKMIGWIWGR